MYRFKFIFKTILILYGGVLLTSCEDNPDGVDISLISGKWELVNTIDSTLNGCFMNSVWYYMSDYASAEQATGDTISYNLIVYDTCGDTTLYEWVTYKKDFFYLINLTKLDNVKYVRIDLLNHTGMILSNTEG
ncbi:MAG: hypothetical protein LBH34_02975, partial [Prevotellaceae bacterium]|nr:hypothetical protein [Prevotellaceae bacterium]